MLPDRQAPTFEPSAGTMQPDEVCEDCGRTATVTLGTTALCQSCKWEVQAAILTRRPDLRVPEVGVGIPTGEGIDGGAPTLKCDICGATWFGDPFMACWWCEQRPIWDHEIQASIDASRFEDYLTDIHDGNPAAIAAAANLLLVAVPRGTLHEEAIRRLQRAVKGAA